MVLALTDLNASNLATGTVDNARLDADLAAIGGLTSAADKGIQFTGSGTAGTFDLTTAGKALLDDVDAAAQRTTLGSRFYCNFKYSYFNNRYNWRLCSFNYCRRRNYWSSFW
jgi:hypothetical protein